MAKNSLIDQEELDRDALLRDFASLLNGLKPKVRLASSEENLSVTLDFTKASTGDASMRRLAVLVADHVL